MSRQVGALAVALSVLVTAVAAPVAAQEGAAMATYRDRTQGSIVCREVAADDEILVCGLRAADRYRVPLVLPDPENPDNVPLRTARLLADTSFKCSVTGPFFARCGGMVGVSASTAIGPGGGKPELRKPAP